MLSSDPKKRQRLDPKQMSAIIRVMSPDLWFDDGNIAIAAAVEETNDTETYSTCFRIHRGVLAKHSPVFSAMFALPQPDGDESMVNETFMGVPLVQLSDKYADVLQFLKVLYDPTALPCKRNSADTIPTVTGVLRLAKKYQIDELCERISEHILQDWPDTLEEWDINEKAIAEQIKKIKVKDEDLDKHLPEPASLIELAHEFPSLHPALRAAFYHLSRVFWKTSDMPNRVGHDWEDAVGRSADLVALSKHDLRGVLLARRYLGENIADFAFSTIARIQCYKRRESCKEALCAWWSIHAIPDLLRGKDKEDPLLVLQELQDDLGRIDEACSRCCEKIRLFLEQQRSSVWEDLWMCFGLHEW